MTIMDIQGLRNRWDAEARSGLAAQVDAQRAKGEKCSDDCATVHVDRSMCLLYVNGGNGRGIVRRLGCPGLKIDGK